MVTVHSPGIRGLITISSSYVIPSEWMFWIVGVNGFYIDFIGHKYVWWADNGCSPRQSKDETFLQERGSYVLKKESQYNIVK